MASRWRERWTPADGIEPWLRRHLDEMTGLVRDERWRWEDIARALDLAGISYAAAGRGRPWTAALLMDKAAKLRGQRRKHQARQVLSGQGELTVTAELLREALSRIGVVHHLTVNLPGAAPVPPATVPAPVPEARRAVRPARGVTPAAPQAPPAVPQAPPLARSVAPAPLPPPAFDPEEPADVQPEFKPATLKGRSRKPPSDGGTP